MTEPLIGETIILAYHMANSAARNLKNLIDAVQDNKAVDSGDIVKTARLELERALEWLKP